jgi:hypothetical protein
MNSLKFDKDRKAAANSNYPKVAVRGLTIKFNFQIKFNQIRTRNFSKIATFG